MASETANCWNTGARLVQVAALSLLLAACAESRLVIHAAKGLPDTAKQQGNYKVGNPYQINGAWYYPAEDFDYDETGVASWYGPGFHQKTTANGEIFDQNEVTAAHRTLPMPSLVRVTNLDNGRSLVVKVNDRGPYANGRILDLSRKSAQLLGFEKQGTAKVRVQILGEESRRLAAELQGKSLPDETKVAAAPRESVQAESLPPPGGKGANVKAPSSPSPAPKPVQAAPATRPVQVASSSDLKTQSVGLEPVRATNLYIQAGAYARFDNANRARAALSPVGQTKVSSVIVGSQEVFRVRVGPLSSLEEADRALEMVLRSGYPDARLIAD
jgi:rare lipoprotein A